MPVPSSVDIAIVGAGQAGLAMSWFLRQAGREHIVLERRPTLGGGWQDRWDAFRLVTPNWTASLPGFPYDGDAPDGFMARDDISARIARYADVVGAPVQLQTGVDRLTAGPDGSFVLETDRGKLDARQVVVAVGSYHRPRIPTLSAAVPARVAQVHTHEYRNAAALPPGGVLVVGSGQSGVQIAEELREAGRQTFLSLGSAGWAPRRYRGRDLFRWLAEIAVRGGDVGVPFPTVDTLPTPRARLAANPQLSGHAGGHDVDLRQMAADGLTIVGRLEGVDGERLRVSPGIAAALAQADRFFLERFKPLIDRFIERSDIDAPPDERTRSTFEPPEIAVLDLAAVGISTIVWATGYALDYGWIDLPIFDEMGFPRQTRGVSDVPGLYFLGLLWQHSQASATLLGPTIDGPPLLKAMGLPAPVRG